MQDGCVGLNSVTSGVPVLPAQALDFFAFSVGQTEFAAKVEVASV